MNLNGGALDLVYNNGNQTVGLRWSGLTIPKGATITRAYIQFWSSSNQSGATSLTFQGQAADNPTTFTNSTFNISSRPRTVAAATWAPPAWIQNESTTNERTADLTSVIQEVVGRPGWASGNALSVIITGSGLRQAYSWDNKHTRAALLHVEYNPPDYPPVGSLAVTQLATPPNTVSASGAGSTDTDFTPIASYTFDFGDGAAPVTVAAPTTTAQHTYAAAGSYNVTLTVTDTGNLTSTPVTKPITVLPDNPPVASLALSQLASPPYTVSANGSGSTDTDLTPIASYTFNFGDGSAPVTVTAPTTSAQHSYAGVGTFTVTLTATDKAGLTSAPASQSITVTPPPDNAPVASLAVTQLATPALTVNASGAGSTDVDLTPIASYTFDFGDGSPVVTVAAPTSNAQHAYAAPGPYVVTLTATDTGGLTSAPVTKSITVQTDLAPVAGLTVTQLASPQLTVSASGSTSTDTDPTPIASYTFDFGDGTPTVTVNAPTTSAQHTYAAAGTYTVTLTATDTGGLVSAPATASINVIANTSPVAVYVGYYDTHHAVNTQPKPNPWRGSANTIFVGTQDNQPGDPAGGGWDTSCMRVDNLTSGALSIVVTVDIGTHHYALWGTNSLPAGYHLVLAQTAFENFDGSDLNPAGCYGCDPSQCTTLYNATVPVVHVIVNSVSTDYPDPGQYLNTHGVDAAGCPYVGGPLPQTRYDESEAWQQVYPKGQAPPTHAEPTSFAALMSTAPQRSLWLGAPLPNPTRGELFLRFSTPVSGPVRLDLYDLAGRLVRPGVSNVLDAGSYGFQLNVADSEPGIYFVRLSTPMGARNQKLVIAH